MALRNLKSRSRGENGRLTIGVYASFATGNLHATLAEYRRRFPEVDLQTLDGAHSRLICALERDAVDVAVMTSYRAAWPDRALCLWTERVIVALPEGHQLTENSAVSWRQLEAEIASLRGRETDELRTLRTANRHMAQRIQALSLLVGEQERKIAQLQAVPSLPGSARVVPFATPGDPASR
jgi:DNA-binding transcriptional LysR family regulator